MENNLSKFALLILILISIPSQASRADDLKSPKIPADMIKIPAGTHAPFFADKGVKTIRVASFYLDQYAITNAEFLVFVKANPQWAKSKVKGLFADGTYLKHWKSDYQFGADTERLENSPVTNVSWFAAQAFCKWKGKRLPTLIEWEYVGNISALNDKRSVEKIILDWYNKPTPKYLPLIGSTFHNKFNVADMHGLIWEWVSDFNSIIMTGDSRSNQAINSDLFCAGASTNAIDKENYAAFMRFAFRSSLRAKYTINNLGFRCASDIK